VALKSVYKTTIFLQANRDERP